MNKTRSVVHSGLIIGISKFCLLRPYLERGILLVQIATFFQFNVILLHIWLNYKVFNRCLHTLKK